jgi:hypothetical protein
MTSCLSNLYTINFTDKNKDHILVSKGELIIDRADIAFVGKTKQDYGEVFNENVLHLLENFACPEDSGNPGNPDLSTAIGSLLENPIEGQIWYNTTTLRPYRYDGTNWGGLGSGCDIAGNYGVIAHGEQLPLPICPITGYVFTYDECTWIVSPFNYPDEIEFMQCFTDDNALVTMQYRPTGSSMTNGFVNYQIIGIRGNANIGTIGPPPSQPVVESPTPTPTATVTPTVTATPTVTVNATVTPTPTMTSTVSITPSNTPEAGTSPTPTPTNTATPSSTPASTPNPTQSPTPNVTPTPSKTPAVTPTPTVTPTRTPSVTPSPSPDTQGDVLPATYQCGQRNQSACITISNSGFVNAAACGISSPWVDGGFRAGESGADYTFTVTQDGPQTASGPTSGDFSSPRSWCLGVPPIFGQEFNATVNVTITGPVGTSGGIIVLELITLNEL